MPGLLDTFVLEFPIPSEARTQFQRSCHFQSPTSSRSAREDSGLTDIRKTRFDLRQALDCKLATVTDRTLPQSARTTHPFGLLFACSISGITGSLESPFPDQLQLAASLHRQLRQPGCGSEFHCRTCAQQEASFPSADLLFCRSFENTLWYPSAPSPTKRTLVVFVLTD